MCANWRDQPIVHTLMIDLAASFVDIREELRA